MHSQLRSVQAIRLRDTEGSALRADRFACRSNQRSHAMRTFDFAPFYRSTVGLDRMFSMLDQLGGEDLVVSQCQKEPGVKRPIVRWRLIDTGGNSFAPGDMAGAPPEGEGWIPWSDALALAEAGMTASAASSTMTAAATISTVRMSEIPRRPRDTRAPAAGVRWEIKLLILSSEGIGEPLTR